MVRIALAAALALAACQSSDVSRRLGARCDVTSDCDQKCLAPGADWPGGFCTTACMTSEECGNHATCIAEDGGICAFPCSGNDADCAFLGEGYTCQLVDLQEAPSQAGVCRGG